MRSKIEMLTDRKIGICLFGFSLVVYFVLIPLIPVPILQISHASITARSFPNFLCILLGMLSITIIIFPTNKNYSVSVTELMSMAIIVAILIVYLVMMQVVGFVVSSVLVSYVLMVKFGAKNKLIALIISILLPVVIYIVFQKVFSTRFPAGLLF